ncbi:MAG: hypothetical protein IIU39_02010 [Ruminococcus sp.]|nr:hypothetical protein [Ruminococcus sp.]
MTTRGRISVFTTTVLLILTIMFSFSAVSASAVSNKSNKLPKTTQKSNEFAKAYKYQVKGQTSYGYDWTYKIDTKNVKVSCKYDFKEKQYTFKVTGKKYGLTNVTLKYKKSDNSWVSVPMKIFVDPKKNIMRTKV